MCCDEIVGRLPGDNMDFVFRAAIIIVRLLYSSSVRPGEQIKGLDGEGHPVGSGGKAP